MSNGNESRPTPVPEDDPKKREQPNNPLHGVKLADILEHLVEKYGWAEMGQRINIRCFTHDPSIKSSLKFLRKTQWARDKVERLYLNSVSTGPGKNFWERRKK